MLAELNRRWRRWAAHNRVRVTMVLSLAYVAFSVPTPRALAAGAALIALGQGLRFWAAGYLEKNVRLARGGPYRLVRHPLYVGSFVMGVGLAVAVRYPLWWLAAYALLFLGFFVPAIHVEELRLQSIFGAEYQELAVEVPALLPRLPHAPRAGAATEAVRFSWRRVLDNYELRSAAAMAGLIGLQVAKLWLG